MSPKKFYINLDVPEVAAYFERFEASKIFPQMLAGGPSKALTTGGNGAAIKKTIAELMLGPNADIMLGQRYICSAKVVGLDVDHGWFYTVCKKCTKKMPPAEMNLGCQGCNVSQAEAVPL